MKDLSINAKKITLKKRERRVKDIEGHSGRDKNRQIEGES
jgi:hypothetical protein